MVGTNKILTVSYGTFSCTLEGFDDPFSTMRSIAEYFRDLAADDRYFGAEPPTPDAEMLHRIAEREVQRRVEAQVQTDGILLRQVEADNAAAVEEFDSTAKVEDKVEDTAEELAAPDQSPTEEEPADVAAPEVPAESSESVAEKLSRIRAVVARTREAEQMLVDHDGADQPEDHEDHFVDAEVADEDMSDEVAADEVAAHAETSDEPVADAPEEEIAEAFAEFDDAETADAEAADAEEDTAEEHQAAAEEITVAEAADEQSEQDAVAEDDDEGTWTPEPEFEEPEFEQQQGEAAEAPAEMSEALGEDHEGTEEEGAAEEQQDEDAGEAEAEVVSLQSEDDAVTDETSEEDRSDADPLSLETPWTEFDQDGEDTATEAEAESDAEDIEAVSDDHEDEAADDSLTAGIREAIGEMDRDDEDDGSATWTDTDEELDEAARQSELEEKLEAGQLAARDRLGVDRDETEESGDVERLLEETDSQLADTEASRRRSAIAHLKAAVAATKADRLLKRVTAREKNEVAEQAQYRDDLAQVVRPRRPAEAGEHHSERPRPLEENKAPLMLISELRVDEETGAQTTDSIMPVRPRRVSADSDDGGESAASFAEFAKEMGATDLPDLLEAAAAYAAFVENRPHFSRPQLMKRVAKYDRSADFSREDGLRSFGQLLRQGKIQKLKRGQFTVAETTRFNPDSRIAGE